MARIFLVEARAILQYGLKEIVQLAPDMTVVAEASRAAQARTLAHSCEWDAAILDIAFPDGVEFDLVQEWRREYPHRPILIFTLYPDEQLALRALKAGVAGYLTIDNTPEEVITALRNVMAGHKHIPSWLTERMISALTRSAVPHETLSNREYEIFCLLASGKTISEIGRQLRLSVKTISTHRARILEKVNLKNNAQLTQYAITHGLVRIQDAT
ncbi:MAG: response regulator transcription factor [Deltaproteobacteria bacterium]|nr:response regulator transcription factor [Deltaproteobacteria bacterium]